MKRALVDRGPEKQSLESRWVTNEAEKLKLPSDHAVGRV